MWARKKAGFPLCGARKETVALTPELNRSPMLAPGFPVEFRGKGSPYATPLSLGCDIITIVLGPPSGVLRG